MTYPEECCTAEGREGHGRLCAGNRALSEAMEVGKNKYGRAKHDIRVGRHESIPSDGKIFSLVGITLNFN